MELIPSFIPLLTIAISIGLPALLLIQLFNKKSTLLKIPSLKIWKLLINKIGVPPKTKINILNLSFLVQLILLCLIAYLCSSPILLQENKKRPIFNILINRSTSMATKTDEYSSRWEHLKKTLHNRLLDIGLKSDDVVNLYFNPPINIPFQGVPFSRIDKIINDTSTVDLPPIEGPFFQLSKGDLQNIYITDSENEIPASIKDKFSIIFIKDNAHINVGWIEFWVEDQIVNGVLKNFSDYSLNVNVDLKINGVSIQANDFAPPIKPRESFLFQRSIPEDFNNINLIEVSVDCPGDALESDNLISLSRIQSQKLKILITPEVSRSVVKGIRALGDSVVITQGDIALQAIDNKFDLIVSNSYKSHLKMNQIIINPTEGNSLFHIIDNKSSGLASASQWLNLNEQKLLENVTFENVHEAKDNSPSVKLLTEASKGMPLVAKWKLENKSIFLFNFDCSETATITKTPLFPFIIAKVIQDMNFNSFHYFKTGDFIDEMSISSKQTKVYQSNRKGRLASVNFNNAETVLLTNAGIFSNENINICVNLLNAKESDIKQPPFSDQITLQFNEESNQAPIDLRPYIAGLILMIITFEWLYSKKETA